MFEANTRMFPSVYIDIVSEITILYLDNSSKFSYLFLLQRGGCDSYDTVTRMDVSSLAEPAEKFTDLENLSMNGRHYVIEFI